MPLRTKGSPPVRRIFSTPKLAAIRTIRSISSKLNKCDAVRMSITWRGTAIIAAQITSIHHRDTQITDPPPEAIGHRRWSGMTLKSEWVDVHLLCSSRRRISGTHEPQPVPAFKHCPTASTLFNPCVLIACWMVFSPTLKHAHTFRPVSAAAPLGGRADSNPAKSSGVKLSLGEEAAQPFAFRQTLVRCDEERSFQPTILQTGGAITSHRSIAIFDPISGVVRCALYPGAPIFRQRFAGDLVSPVTCA